MMIGELNVYSCYSFQNSTILIDKLCARAKELKLEALALTDEDNMFGAMEFSQACHKYGIKPIFGMQASVSVENEVYPFLLLSIDQTGYHDLMKICSEINLSESHAIELEHLSTYKDHLFILSGCKEGLIERLVLKEMESQALKYLEQFKKLFGKNYYICIQNHHLKLQQHLNERLQALATLAHIKVCASNSVRYLDKKDALTLDLLQASKKGLKLDINYQPVTNQMYLKAGYEMSLLFPKEIIENTNEIIRRCHVTIDTHQMHLPKYPLSVQATSQQYLRELCIVGLKKRFKGMDVPQDYIQRLKKELEVIHKMGFDDYFLIVFDYVRYAKNHHILVGPGRGSAAGSLVSYVLGITNVDPLKYNLFFERFLNEERISMPDIDIDFQDDRRDEVVEYVTNKYGQHHAGQIVTFSTYGPKVALKDLGKVVSVPLPKLELLTKYIPTGKNKKTVQEVYQTSYAFCHMIDQEPALKRILPAISVVEHLPRNISMHAAGVVLSSDPLIDVVPLTKGPNHHLLTQYSKDYIETVGLLKMDFLGLKNLTIIAHILKSIQHHQKIELKLNDLDYCDKKTFDMISRGDTLGVFQLESPGMKNLLRQMKPHCLEDIIDAIALFRPGPMNEISHFIARRFKKEKIEYPLPELKNILESTNGVFIYQEQIMQVAQVIAGFSLSKADVLRKAMSKKTASLMAEMKNDFIDGAVAKGYRKDIAIHIFELIERFADYGFNKSHSVAYGIVAYQLAYLKANYPLAFYSAVLTNEQGSDKNKANYMSEARKYGIKILLPSVNFSTDRFEVENGHIRYSLLGIKNVGMAGCKAILNQRQEGGSFKDLYDFVSRMDDSRLNTKMMESLTDAGAFDEFGINRATIKANLTKIMEYADLKNKIGIDEPPILDHVNDHKMTKLESEKNVLGVYLSKHPIVYVKQRLKQSVIPAAALNQYVNQRVTVVLQLSRVRPIIDKKGNEMCFIEGYDETGNIEGVVFSFAYQKAKLVLQRGKIVYIEGKIEYRDKLSLIVNTVKDIN